MAGLGRVRPALPPHAPCPGTARRGDGIRLLGQATWGRPPRVPTPAPREGAEPALLRVTAAPGVTGNGMDAGSDARRPRHQQNRIWLCSGRCFLKQKVYLYSKYRRCPERRLCFLINRLASAEMKVQN